MKIYSYTTQTQYIELAEYAHTQNIFFLNPF
jgi:hypothetical protein